MKYIQYTLTLANEELSDITVANLADLGFESFSEYDPQKKSIDAFIQQPLLTSSAEQYLHQNSVPFNTKEIEQQNWNAQWESSFEPIDVEGRCYIRATFHKPKPCEHEIVITPKMSFGTGHHPTTHLMVQAMLNTNTPGTQGLDMGSGTGILAILAAKLGAVQIDAVDIDEWAYENCVENISMNDVTTNVCPILGDVSSIKGRSYDFILANINRNILLADMPAYVTTLRAGGSITMSGFLEIDAHAITQRAEELNLKSAAKLTRNGWVCLRFTKQ